MVIAWLVSGDPLTGLTVGGMNFLLNANLLFP